VNALLAAEKRLTSMLAFVPVWGLRKLSRSEQHTSGEKSLLALASLGMTMLLGLGIVAILPSAKERAEQTRAKVRQQIDTLARLVEEYRREHGALPDELAWQRSATSADLRFYDPWGRIFHYRPNDDGFAIASYGRDGALGGEGEDTDLSVEFPPAPEPGPGTER
jgi:general secretion pathway protein G